MSGPLDPEEVARWAARLAQASAAEVQEALDRLRTEMAGGAGGGGGNAPDPPPSGDTFAYAQTAYWAIEVPMPAVLVYAVDEAVSRASVGDEISLDLALKAVAATFLTLAAGAAAIGSMEFAERWAIFSAFVDMLRRLGRDE